MENTTKNQIERLLELKKLYESGILTKEEMEAEKAKILGTETMRNADLHEEEQVANDDDGIEKEGLSYIEKNKTFIIAISVIVGIAAAYFLFTKVINPPEVLTATYVENTDGATDNKLEQLHVDSYEQRIKEEINSIKEYADVIGVDGNIIYYLKKTEAENVCESTGNSAGHIQIYNVADYTSTSVEIDNPSGCSYTIDSYAYQDGKITFILSDIGRNGFGIGNYSTEVTQYNAKTGIWITIAEECANAEFIKDKTEVKVTWAEITNEDEATAAYEYEYKYNEETIAL